MKTSENINEIAKAMSQAQKDMKPASKDGVNPHFKSKYFTFSSVWESIRQPLTNCGLTVWQDVITEEKSVSVITRVIHESGQWVEFGPLSIPLMKFDAQAIGSATSYAKRYSLCAAVGVVSDDDDDGEKAVEPMRKIYSQSNGEKPSPPAYAPKPAESPKAVEEKVETISPAQSEELKLLKSTASQEVSLKVDRLLAERNLKNFKELPASGFDYMKDLLLKNQKPDFILGGLSE